MKALRGPAVSALLRRLGMDPQRYWLLMDLFRELTERRELFGQTGRNSLQLKSAVHLYFVMMGLLALVMLIAQPPAGTYFWMFQLMGVFFMFMILMPEAGHSLVNPEEALVLAHQPVNGATYNAAKLSHLVRIVLFLVPGIHGVAAFAGLTLAGARWWYPLMHLGAAWAAGLAVAFTCCAIFGWLIRFVPAPRLRTFGQVAEALPFVLIMMPRGDLPDWFSVPPEYRIPIAVGLTAVAIAGVAGGLRALSGDYLIRVTSMMSAASGRKKTARRSIFAGVVGRRLGQPARAGFTYAKLLMRRDAQFRRQLLMVIPSAVIFGGLAARTSSKSPFGGEFTAAHVLPHMYAMVCLFVCIGLAYGAHYKAVWVFLTFPSGGFRGFVRGVHALLWIGLVLFPHILMLAAFAYLWGPRDAVVFAAYSGAMASLYLGLTLRLVEGIPFGKPAEVVRTDLMMPVMFGGLIVIGALVLFQYAVLFVSWEPVAGAAALVALAAWFATRGSLGAFEASIHHHLGLLNTGTKQIYTEVDL